MSAAAPVIVVATSPRLSLVTPAEGRVVVPAAVVAATVVVVPAAVVATVVVVHVLLCAAVASGDAESKVIVTDATLGSV